MSEEAVIDEEPKYKIDVENEIMKGVVDLIRHKPFYGHILQQMAKIFVRNKKDKMGNVIPAEIPTMAVGKRRNEMLIKLFVNKARIGHSGFP